MNKKIIFSIIFIILISLSSIVKAETIIYDNITTSNCKTLKILLDYSNIKFINEYSYDVYLNDYFLGDYNIDDNICYQDNSDIKININSKINSDINNKQIDNVLYRIPIFSGLGFFFLLFIIVIAFIYWRLKK